MSVSCAAWSADLAGAEVLARRAVAAGVEAIDWPAAAVVEFGVEFAADDRVRALNKEHRGQDRATNVLSFPVESLADASPGAPLMLGDIVLAHGVVRAEAQAQGKTLADHACHLIVHGLLHLAGHDHQDAAAAEAMEHLERRILAGLGITDPYDLGGSASP